MNKLMVLFAGGGTGGHLFPALAIAERLKAKVEPECRADFRFVGTRKGIEYRMKDKLGYPLSLISVRGLHRSGFLRNIVFPILLAGATLKSIYLILRYSPDVVVGTGGYVMGPVIMGAVAMNRRCVIQEQNSYPGLTTRRLAPKVDKVFLGFGTASKYLDKGCNISETGNPVRGVIGGVSREEARENYQFNSADKVILILGGSQGAASINQNILDNMDSLPNGYQIIWQTGELNYREVAAVMGGRIKESALFSVTDKIEMAYAAADLVIARAGALTLAELEWAGLPSILIPYPHATGNHQRKNAEHFVENGAAVVFNDSELANVNLLGEVVQLIESGRYREMAKAVDTMRGRRKKPAADMIVDEILELISFKRSGS